MPIFRVLLTIAISLSLPLFAQTAHKSSEWQTVGLDLQKRWTYVSGKYYIEYHSLSPLGTIYLSKIVAKRNPEQAMRLYRIASNAPILKHIQQSGGCNAIYQAYGTSSASHAGLHVLCADQSVTITSEIDLINPSNGGGGQWFDSSVGNLLVNHSAVCQGCQPGGLKGFNAYFMATFYWNVSDGEAGYYCYTGEFGSDEGTNC